MCGVYSGAQNRLQEEEHLMGRSLPFRATGLFLVLFGAGILTFTWWSYGVTHQAFESLRGFSKLVDDERLKVTQAVEKASGLMSASPTNRRRLLRSGAQAPSEPVQAPRRGRSWVRSRAWLVAPRRELDQTPPVRARAASSHRHRRQRSSCGLSKDSCGPARKAGIIWEVDPCHPTILVDWR